MYHSLSASTKAASIEHHVHERFLPKCVWLRVADLWAVRMQVYEVNRKLLQEHAAPLMAVYLHGVAVVRQELNMDVGRKSITGATAFTAASIV